jgi:hypothetical protein
VPSQLVPIVGRDAEVQAIARSRRRGRREAGVLAPVGDAGVGKSRLAEEGMALARAYGFVTLHAAASPLYADCQDPHAGAQLVEAVTEGRTVVHGDGQGDAVVGVRPGGRRPKAGLHVRDVIVHWHGPMRCALRRNTHVLRPVAMVVSPEADALLAG